MTTNKITPTETLALVDYVNAVLELIDSDASDDFARHFAPQILTAFSDGRPAYELAASLARHFESWFEEGTCARASESNPDDDGTYPFYVRLSSGSYMGDRVTEFIDIMAIPIDDEGRTHGAQCYFAGALDGLTSSIEGEIDARTYDDNELHDGTGLTERLTQVDGDDAATRVRVLPEILRGSGYTVYAVGDNFDEEFENARYAETFGALTAKWMVKFGPDFKTVREGQELTAQVRDIRQELDSTSTADEGLDSYFASVILALTGQQHPLFVAVAATAQIEKAWRDGVDPADAATAIGGYGAAPRER